jgi:hypothetical protein
MRVVKSVIFRTRFVDFLFLIASLAILTSIFLKYVVEFGAGNCGILDFMTGSQT